MRNKHRSKRVCAECGHDWPCEDAAIDRTNKCAGLTAKGKPCPRQAQSYGAMPPVYDTGLCRMHAFKVLERQEAEVRRGIRYVGSIPAESYVAVRHADK